MGNKDLLFNTTKKLKCVIMKAKKNMIIEILLAEIKKYFSATLNVKRVQGYLKV